MEVCDYWFTWNNSPNWVDKTSSKPLPGRSLTDHCPCQLLASPWHFAHLPEELTRNLLGYDESFMMRKRGCGGTERSQWLILCSVRWQEVQERLLVPLLISFSTFVLQMNRAEKRTENKHLTCHAYLPLLCLLARVKTIHYKQKGFFVCFLFFAMLCENVSGFDI